MVNLRIFLDFQFSISDFHGISQGFSDFPCQLGFGFLGYPGYSRIFPPERNENSVTFDFRKLDSLEQEFPLQRPQRLLPPSPGHPLAIASRSPAHRCSMARAEHTAACKAHDASALGSSVFDKGLNTPQRCVCTSHFVSC